MVSPRAVSFDNSANIVLVGDFHGLPIDPGGGPLTNAGLRDIFIARFSSYDSHLWSKRFGDGAEQYGFDIATDPSNDIVVTGTAQGDVDFGAGTLAGGRPTDIYVAKFGADGKVRWTSASGVASTTAGPGGGRRRHGTFRSPADSNRRSTLAAIG
jgi:hypothetical protein